MTGRRPTLLHYLLAFLAGFLGRIVWLQSHPKARPLPTTAPLGRAIARVLRWLRWLP